MVNVTIKETKVGTINTIEWPIVGTSPTNIRDTVVGVISLFEKQQKQSVSIHQIIVGSKVLDGLSFSYREKNIFLNYIESVAESRMRIFVIIPDTKAVEEVFGVKMKKVTTPKKKK